MLIAVALAIIGVVTVFYVGLLNKAISKNIISSISKIAEHDMLTIIALPRCRPGARTANCMNKK